MYEEIRSSRDPSDNAGGRPRLAADHPPQRSYGRRGDKKEIFLQQSSLARHWARDWRALALTQERKKENIQPNGGIIETRVMALPANAHPRG